MNKFTIDFKGLNDAVKPIIGIITILAVFGYLYGITFTEVKLSHDIVPQVLIAIVAFGKDIYNYFFGSSQGLAKANDTIVANASNPVVGNSENTTVEAKK